MGVSQNYGYLFGGPNNKDYSILGSILGSPYFGKLPYLACKQEGKAVCLLLTRCSSQGPCRYMSGCQYSGPFLDPYYNTALIHFDNHLCVIYFEHHTNVVGNVYVPMWPKCVTHTYMDPKAKALNPVWEMRGPVWRNSR